jgi:hypothetical protein
MKNTRKEIDKFLDVYSEEQLKTILEIMRTFVNGGWNKSDIMDIVYTKEENNKIDSALPCDYVKAIQEVYPQFNWIFNVYNYNEPNSMGAMDNIAEKFIKHLANTLNYNNLKE